MVASLIYIYEETGDIRVVKTYINSSHSILQEDSKATERFHAVMGGAVIKSR